MIPKLFIARTPDGMGFPLPSYTSKFHGALNLLAAVGAPVKINPNERLIVPVGFAIGVPDGLCGLIVSHPILAEKHGIIVSDAPHILNPADRGAVFVLIQNVSSNPYVLHRGEEIAQLLVMPAFQIAWQEVSGSIQGHTTDEKEMVLDEGSVDNTKVRNIFQSTRRPKMSLRNRYSVPDDDKI
ncbi:MAG: hypothetical protein SPL08_03045 [Pseudomonadota bacterium]|nr:hypothetical protein [Pseudomonadota bacterium]